MSVWGKSGVSYSQERSCHSQLSPPLAPQYVGSYLSKPQGWATAQAKGGTPTRAYDGTIKDTGVVASVFKLL